jgi:hypothetical protein
MSGKERMDKCFKINIKSLKHAGGENKWFLQKVA